MDKAKKASFLMQNKKHLILLLLGVSIGALMLVLGTNENSKKPDTDTQADERYDMIAYCDSLEERAASLCEGISGVSSVRVMVTLDGGFENVYAEDTKIVTVGSGSSESTVLVKRKHPEIKGIGVVCVGGDDPRIQKEICALLCAVFDLSSTRIYVAGSAG